MRNALVITRTTSITSTAFFGPYKQNIFYFDMRNNFMLGDYPTKNKYRCNAFTFCCDPDLFTLLAGDFQAAAVCTVE